MLNVITSAQLIRYLFCVNQRRIRQKLCVSIKIEKRLNLFRTITNFNRRRDFNKYIIYDLNKKLGTKYKWITYSLFQFYFYKTKKLKLSIDNALYSMFCCHEKIYRYLIYEQGSLSWSFPKTTSALRRGNFERNGT